MVTSNYLRDGVSGRGSCSGKDMYSVNSLLFMEDIYVGSTTNNGHVSRGR